MPRATPPQRKLLILGDAALFKRVEAARIPRCELYLAPELADARRALSAHADLALLLVSSRAGADSLAALLEQRPGLRALVLTSDAWLVRAMRSMTLGAVAGLLAENATPTALRRAVQAAFETIAARRAARPFPLPSPPRGPGAVHDAVAPWGAGGSEPFDLRADWMQVIAHDLRTPLGIQNGYLELLLSGDAPPGAEMREILQRLHGSGQWMLEMVEGILDLARRPLADAPLHARPTPLSELLDGVLERMRGLAAPLGVRLERTRSRDVKRYALDRARIEQVLHNLVINAIQASPPGGVVRISARAQGNKLRFSVRDEGRGMTREEAAGAFAGPAMAQGRRGLGLAICKAIVELHGGHIWAESDPGQGSLFCFTIVPAAEQVHHNSVSAPRRARSRNRR
jgi:signal transduction histidine kinase